MDLLLSELDTALDLIAYRTGHSKRLNARFANNMLQRFNWTDAGDGKLNYQSPPDEAAHLVAMEPKRVDFVRSTEIESHISLAIDGAGQYATSATARGAVA
jgi:hypothetical protein